MEVVGQPVSGVWSRHIPGGGDVHYWADPPADNRWQRGSVDDALYFASDEDTAWAEWYRAAAELGLPPSQLMPRDMWDWEISLPDVADMSTAKRLAKVGLALPEPTHSEWPEFQEVGEELHAEGWPALVAPSAARPQGLVLCVFRGSAIVPGTRPVPPPTTHDEPPYVPKGMST
ncbi:MAG TPA: RES family NAD+ phosphorylase [Solirubrobacterales bacterium]